MATPARRSRLGEFLRTRRALVRPEAHAIAGGTRRTPGLRREEIALLAGVSVDYYVPLGLLNVTRTALPAQGSGHIVNISSSAGFASSAGRGLYSASKFAVEAIPEALHGERPPFGVHVTAVEPGSFRTGFLTTDSRRRPAAEIPAYAGTVGALQAAVEANDGKQPGDPVRAAAAIRELVAAAEPPVRLPLGSDCVGLVEGKPASVGKELDQWRELALSTDY